MQNEAVEEGLRTCFVYLWSIAAPLAVARSSQADQDALNLSRNNFSTSLASDKALAAKPLALTRMDLALAKETEQVSKQLLKAFMSLARLLSLVCQVLLKTFFLNTTQGKLMEFTFSE